MAYVFFYLFLLLSMSFLYFSLNKIFNYEYRSSKLPFIISLVVLTASSLWLLATSVDARQQLDRIDALMTVAFAVSPYLIAKPNKKFVFLWFGLLYSATMDFSSYTLRSVLDFFGLQEKGFLKNLSYFSKEYLYLSLVLILIYIIILILYKKITAIKSFNILDRIPVWVYIAIFFADFASYYKTLSMQSELEYWEPADRVLTLLSGILVVTCIIYGILKYSSAIQKQQQAELQLALQFKHYEELTRVNTDIRKFRHDIKNNLFAIRVLVSEQKSDEALAYIDEMDSNIGSARMKYYTGNLLADAIISDKAEKASKDNIQISFSGSIPNDGVDNYDLCTILTNAIDNAVEACQKIGDKSEIKISGQEKKQAFSISFSNPVIEDVIIKNNKIKTSKSDKENHGFGTQNIKKIVEQNNGTIKFSCENKIFTLRVALTKKMEVNS